MDKERNKHIYEEYRKGKSFAEIGRMYNLTTERIRQIVNKEKAKSVDTYWVDRFPQQDRRILIENHITNEREFHEALESGKIVLSKNSIAENSTKAKNDGLYPTGLDNKATKLDPDLKDEVAYLYEYSDMTIRDLAEVYGVSKSRIQQIVHEVGWTDIGEWTDTKGKVHQPADSPRYKALGNSIATPFWFYLLRRISAQYERPATLGSLFDGISGFPLAWARCNGPKSVLFSSEIEEFPIAVCKRHFGDEETGEEGDIAEYL